MTKILLPSRPQVDTAIAVFLLQTFGEAHFPGIAKATVEFTPGLDEGATESSLAEQGVVLVDIGRGKFDHHAKSERTTATDLVAAYLEVAADPALQKLREFARRDDFYGKGIVSGDPLDRAFGLPGLLANLNKQWVHEPGYVLALVLPFIAAPYAEELQRTPAMPQEIAAEIAAGRADIFTVPQRGKKLKVIIIASANVSLPGYLRSQLGGRYDVVVQCLPSGHVNVLTRPTKQVDLRRLVALVRQTEAQHAGQRMQLPMHLLAAAGRIEEIPQWFYDPATNSLQNGGVNPKDTPPTKIPSPDFHRLLTEGLTG